MLKPRIDRVPRLSLNAPKIEVGIEEFDRIVEAFDCGLQLLNFLLTLGKLSSKFTAFGH